MSDAPPPPPPPPQNVGYVTIRNPTRTVFFVNVNGDTEFRVEPDDVRGNLVRLPRSANGNPCDGQFGYENQVDVAPESAGARFDPIKLSIPRWLQTAFDLELCIFFRSDPTMPDYLLHWSGLVIDYELARHVIAAATRPQRVTPLHAADTPAARGTVS
jgi:hypothetical protein